MNWFIKKYRHYTNWRWEIGILDNSLAGVVSGEKLVIHWVDLPFRDRWFADPFILDYNDKVIVLLCEEYSDKLCKGRIAKIIIDRSSYKLKSWEIILEIPTHLSFPRPLREGNKVFVHPENSASGNHRIYYYDQEKGKLIDGRVICDEPLTDPVMLDYQDRQLLFSTYEPNPNGKILTVYEKREEKYQKIDEIVFNNNCARMAGDFFEVDGKLYRPAQDCNGDYGRAVILQAVNRDNDGDWRFSDVRKLKSKHPVLKWGLHTFNHYKELVVIDVKGPRYPILADILLAIKKVIQLFSSKV